MAFECRRCSACCRSYWITMLPSELSAMAKELNLDKKNFTKKYSQLFLQLFPAPSRQEKGLIVPAEKIPARFLKKIENATKERPVAFIALPSVAFKRRKETCVLLEKAKKACLVHSSKPGQCSLFPFISLSESPDFSSLYGFCKGLSEKPEAPAKWKKVVEAHYAAFSKYFISIQENGFRKLWKNWPKKGLLLVKNKKISNITEKEFFEIIKGFS